MLQLLLTSYHNADAWLRFFVRCLLFTPLFIAGCACMAVLERLHQ
jgi:hypothetical protein